MNKKRSKKVQKKYETRQKTAKVEPALEEQFQTGRLLGEFGLVLVKFTFVFTVMKNFKRVHLLVVFVLNLPSNNDLLCHSYSDFNFVLIVARGCGWIFSNGWFCCSLLGIPTWTMWKSRWLRFGRKGTRILHA